VLKPDKNETEDLMSEVKGITSMMGEKRSFNPPKEFTKSAYIKSMAEYKKL